MKKQLSKTAVCAWVPGEAVGSTVNMKVCKRMVGKGVVFRGILSNTKC